MKFSLDENAATFVASVAATLCVAVACLVGVLSLPPGEEVTRLVFSFAASTAPQQLFPHAVPLHADVVATPAIVHAAASPPPPPPPPPPLAILPVATVVSWKAPVVSRAFRKPVDGRVGPPGSECHEHGVYSPALHECRCTAGWGGRFCEVREKRPCNYNTDGSPTNADALCAGNCDEDRGHCYCAGLPTPFERPLPHYCAPWAHRLTKLPDGRPAYPVQRRDQDGTWELAKLHFERPNKERPWLGDWARYYLKPFDNVYGSGTDVPAIPNRRGWPPVTTERAGWCEASAKTSGKPLALNCGGCYEGRSGKWCDQPKRMYCLRDCMGRGRCDSGFCWCDKGWYGIDCGQRTQKVAAAGPAGAVAAAFAGTGGAPALAELATPVQSSQTLPSRAAHSPLRVYVYDMPAEFTTRMLQYRPSPSMGLHRSYDQHNQSKFSAGSLYAMESSLHEWFLDSPLRTTDGEKAHLFYVPVYAASLFMWPISKFADEPYYGRKTHENRRRSHQGALFLKRALYYIKKYYPFWDAHGGKDHLFLMLHDEGPCFAPRELRASILLTHYGYWSAHPKPWGTYYDDNFMQDPRFYKRHLGDPQHPTPCFKRDQDLVIPPWKTPSFWQGAFEKVKPATNLRRERTGLVFFAGDLGLNRLPGYSHDLRQRAYSMFCDPKTTKMRDCTPYVYGCRKEFPLNCSRWEPGVSIQLHSRRYHEELMGHTFCLAFPGDGWSSRVLDAVVHGCIPVVVQDESEMFFEGAFKAAGLPIDYEDFSIRVAEAQLPDLVPILRAVPPATITRMRRAVLWVRDYFVYKDMYSPYAAERASLQEAGRPGQDAFLLLALALESRARVLGKLPPDTPGMPPWRARNRKLLGAMGPAAAKVFGEAHARLPGRRLRRALAGRRLRQRVTTVVATEERGEQRHVDEGKATRREVPAEVPPTVHAAQEKGLRHTHAASAAPAALAVPAASAAPAAPAVPATDAPCPLASRACFSVVNASGASFELALQLTVAQGLANREYEAPAVYVVGLPRFPGMAGIEWFPGTGCDGCAGVRERWLETVRAAQPGRTAVPLPPAGLLAQVRPLVRGGALYEADAPHSLGPVLTACGVHGLLPAAAPETLPAGLGVRFDGRRRWADATAAAWFVARELLPHTNASTLALQAPTNLPFLADAIVAWKLAVVWMEDMCRDPEQNAALRHVVEGSGHFDAAPIVQYFGWFNNTHLPNVELVCQCTKSKRLVTIASDWAENLSFLARVGGTAAASDHAAHHRGTPSPAEPTSVEDQPPAARRADASTAPADAVRVSHYDARSTYIAIVVSDGDNLAQDWSNLRPMLERRVALQSRVPVSWTVSNRWLDFGTPVLNWVYHTVQRTAGYDSLLMGPSGYGYLFPGAIGEAAHQAAFAQATVAAAQALDMQAYVHWDVDQALEPASRARTTAAVARYNGTAVRGAFMLGSDPIAPLVGDVVVINKPALPWGFANASAAAATLNALPRGTISYVYANMKADPALLDALAAELSPHVVLLGHRELLRVARTAAEKAAAASGSGTHAGDARHAPAL